jgi:hypothetical protein
MRFPGSFCRQTWRVVLLTEGRLWCSAGAAGGQGREDHPPAFWAELVGALREVGYTDILSIENEDWMQDRLEGVAEAAAMMTTLLAGEQSAATVTESLGRGRS